MYQPNRTAPLPERIVALNAWADLIAAIVIQRLIEEPGYVHYLAKRLPEVRAKVGTLRHLHANNHPVPSKCSGKPVDPSTERD